MKVLTTMAIVLALSVPVSATALEKETVDNTSISSAPVIVKSLTDYPGRVRDVTETQKAEIRAVLATQRTKPTCKERTLEKNSLVGMCQLLTP